MLMVKSIKVADEEQVLGGLIPVECYSALAMGDAVDDFSVLRGGLDFSVVLIDTEDPTAVSTLSEGWAVTVGLKGDVRR